MYEDNTGGRFAPTPITINPLGPRAKHWVGRYADLNRWLLAHGTHPSESSQDQDEVRLARWVVRQRAVRWRLTEAQQQLLRGVPGWSWDPRADRFEGGFLDALEFVQEHGHLPRRQSADPDERRAGQFLYRARARRTHLTQNEKERLAAIENAALIKTMKTDKPKTTRTTSGHRTQPRIPSGQFTHKSHADDTIQLFINHDPAPGQWEIDDSKLAVPDAEYIRLRHEREDAADLISAAIINHRLQRHLIVTCREDTP